MSGFQRTLRAMQRRRAFLMRVGLLLPCVQLLFISLLTTDQLSRLHKILKPFMLRRVKKDVEHEMAEKVGRRVEGLK